jgi:hypothetical protein
MNCCCDCTEERNVVNKSFDGAQSELNAEPDEHQGHIELDEIPEKRAHETVTRRGFGSRPRVGHGDQHDPGRSVEARGQSADVTVIDLRHRDELAGLAAHGHRRQSGVAGKQAALGVAHGVDHRVGRGQAALRVRTLFERETAVSYLHVRHHGGGALFEPAIAADDTRRDVIQVMHQRPA